MNGLRPDHVPDDAVRRGIGVKLEADFRASFVIDVESLSGNINRGAFFGGG